MIFPTAWENNSLEKLIDMFPDVALLPLPCFIQISSVCWFQWNSESGDKSPAHLSLNFVGCGAVEGQIYSTLHSKVHLHPPHCSHSHHYPHCLSLLQLSPFWKQGLPHQQWVNTFKRIWHPVMEEKTLWYCLAAPALRWACGGVSHCLLSPNWIKFVWRTDVYGWLR